MEQEKIGKFISQLRKEKNMTQMDLAEKLNVTDKAISKWENGRGLPDLSLMKPLCDELGITINELLSGEKISEIEYKNKSEENILNAINYSDRKINKIKKMFKFIFGLVLAIFITLLTLFIIDIGRMKNNEPVFFSTWGYEYTPAIDLHETEIEIAINEYLVDKIDSEAYHYENEKGFASFRTYLIEELERNNKYNVYAWVLTGNYYLENSEIKQDSGSSIPYKFEVTFVNDKYIVTDSKIPRDGSLYTEDMKNIFPSSVRKDMEEVYYDGTIERLRLEIEQQLKLYFHL